MAKLRIGLFEGWENEYQMILFSGDKETIHQLELIFRNLASGELEEVSFNDTDLIEIYHDIKLKAILSSRDDGLVRKGKSRTYEWILSKDTWETFAELISVFQDNPIGHHYLDSYSNDNTQIMVSVNEYTDDWVGWKNRNRE